MPSISLPWADFLYNVSNVAIVIGAALVLLGTIGTVRLSAIRDWYGDQRLKVNETKTAEANQAAGEANERAGVANREAGRANERAAQLEKEAAELRLTVEHEKGKRLELERDIGDMKPQVRSLMPLALSQEQKDAIASTRPPVGAGQINIALDVAATLMKTFADDMATALVNAGWSVSRSQVMGVGLPPATGVGIGFFNTEPTASQQTVASALTKAKLMFDLQNIGDPPQPPSARPPNFPEFPKMPGYGVNDVRVLITNPVR